MKTAPVVPGSSQYREDHETRATTVVCVSGCFFFFQAEDGIRDSSVTGVQTCALPISDSRHVIGEYAAKPGSYQQLCPLGRRDGRCVSKDVKVKLLARAHGHC